GGPAVPGGGGGRVIPSGRSHNRRSGRHRRVNREGNGGAGGRSHGQRSGRHRRGGCSGGGCSRRSGQGGRHRRNRGLGHRCGGGSRRWGAGGGSGSRHLSRSPGSELLTHPAVLVGVLLALVLLENTANTGNVDEHIATTNGRDFRRGGDRLG